MKLTMDTLKQRLKGGTNMRNNSIGWNIVKGLIGLGFTIGGALATFAIEKNFFPPEPVVEEEEEESEEAEITE